MPGRGKRINQPVPGCSNEGNGRNDQKSKKPKKRNTFYNRGGFRGGFNRQNGELTSVNE